MGNVNELAIVEALFQTQGEMDAVLCVKHGVSPKQLISIAANYGLEKCKVCHRWVSNDETRDGECMGCPH